MVTELVHLVHLFLPLFEPPEVILNEECSIELPNGDVIVTCVHNLRSCQGLMRARPTRSKIKKKLRKERTLTSSRWYDLIQQFRIGSLPDLLDDCSEFLVGLVDVACEVVEH